MSDTTWAKVISMVEAWVQGKLKATNGEVTRSREPDFFNNLFMRCFRGLTDAEVETVLDEVLDGRCFVRTAPGYDGRLDIKSRCVDVKSVNFLRPQILAYANAMHGSIYRNWKELEGQYRQLSYTTLLKWSTTYREWIKKNKDKQGIVHDMPMALSGVLRNILDPSVAAPDVKFRVESLPAHGFSTSLSTVQSHLAVIDTRHMRPAWELFKYMACFDYISNINDASYYWLVCLTSVHNYVECYGALRRVDGGKTIYVGTYDPPLDPSKSVKSHLYTILVMLVNRSETTADPDINFNLFFDHPDHPALKKAAYPASVDTTLNSPLMQYKARYEKHIEKLFRKPMAYSIVQVVKKVDPVVKHSLPSNVAQYLVRTFNTEGGTVLDFFNGGTFARAALCEGHYSICFEYSEEVCRFLTAALDQLQQTIWEPTHNLPADVNEDDKHLVIGGLPTARIEEITADPKADAVEKHQQLDVDDDNILDGETLHGADDIDRLHIASQDYDGEFERAFKIGAGQPFPEQMGSLKDRVNAITTVFKDTEEFVNARQSFEELVAMNRRKKLEGLQNLQMQGECSKGNAPDEPAKNADDYPSSSSTEDEREYKLNDEDPPDQTGVTQATVEGVKETQ